MKTESRNLEWTGILSVVEKQTYSKSLGSNGASHSEGDTNIGGTDVTTTVTLVSRYGQARMLAHKRKEGISAASAEASATIEEENIVKKGFFSSWSTSSLQRSIELVGLRRTRTASVKSKDGMNVVLERLRLGGLVAVLDGMRRDRDAAFGPEGPWKRV